VRFCLSQGPSNVASHHTCRLASARLRGRHAFSVNSALGLSTNLLPGCSPLAASSNAATASVSGVLHRRNSRLCTTTSTRYRTGLISCQICPPSGESFRSRTFWRVARATCPFAVGICAGRLLCVLSAVDTFPSLGAALFQAANSAHSCAARCRLNWCFFTEFPLVVTRMRAMQRVYFTGNKVTTLPMEVRDNRLPSSPSLVPHSLFLCAPVHPVKSALSSSPHRRVSASRSLPLASLLAGFLVGSLLYRGLLLSHPIGRC
jgi:hypothetical protein